MNENEFSLKLGESIRVRPGVFRTTVSVIYTGMINDSTASIAVQASLGHNSWAYNVYFTRSTNQVIIPKGSIEILEISPAFLRFRADIH